jgi:ribosome-associated protein
MLDFLKRLFGLSAKPVEAAPANTTAPYKVPEPAATTPIPLVVTNSNPADNVPVAKKAPAKKAPAKAPAAPKAKAPAKPKAPRASKAKPTAQA